MGKRKSTRYPGVQARESQERRYRGRPDVCFTIDYRDANGKRVRKDVGWASEGFSAALAAEMRSRLINAAKTSQTMGEVPLPERKACLTFGEAWEKYRREWLIANGKDEISPASIVNQHLQQLLPMRLNEITAYQLDRLMATMRRNGKSAQTIRNALGLVRSIIRRVTKWKLYSGPMPFSDITLPRPNNTRERFLTSAEAKDLLAELQKRSHKTWLIALISLHCGLRFGEIARLKLEDIQFDNMTIYIAESKNGRARHVVMTEEVARAIRELPSKNRQALLFPDQNGNVMQSISSSFFRAVDELGLNEGVTDRRQKIVFHTLRHTFASWLALAGTDIYRIKTLMRHRNIEMTMRYAHLIPDATRSAVINLKPPTHS